MATHTWLKRITTLKLANGRRIYFTKLASIAVTYNDFHEDRAAYTIFNRPELLLLVLFRRRQCLRPRLYEEGRDLRERL